MSTIHRILFGWLLVIVEQHSLCTDALTYLVKTRETFKLADLQLLEAELLYATSPFSVKRLVLDGATGSNLLKFSTSSTNARFVPRLTFVDWFGEELVSAQSMDELLRALGQRDAVVEDPWSLKIVKMTNKVSRKQDGYTKQTLACAVAQRISAPIALAPQQAKCRLILVETDSTLVLLRETKATNMQDLAILKSSWNMRPFKYSSSMNFDAACIMVNIASHLAPSEMAKHTLLDITCGSGTFLAMALERDMNAMGIDSNPACVEGARSNLQHVETVTGTPGEWQLRCEDFTTLGKSGIPPHVACVVSNLPWGLNSNLRDTDQVPKLIRSLQQSVPSKIPVILAIKDLEEEMTTGGSENWWEDQGFRLLGVAHIPQRDFRLPSSNKQKKQNDKDKTNERSSCAVYVLQSR